MPAQNSVQYHDQQAVNWEEKHKKRSIQNRIRAFETLVRDIGLDSSGQWLDAGCGSGFFSRWLGSRGCHVTAVDASRKMIQCAKGLSDQKFLVRSPIRFEVVDDLVHLDHPDRSFGGVVCLSVIEYLERPSDTLREFHRLLKPDGYLIISVPNRYALFRMFERFLLGLRLIWTSRQRYLEYSKHWYSKSEIMNLLNANGFNFQKFRYAGMPLPIILDNTVLTGSLIFVLAKKQ